MSRKNGGIIGPANTPVGGLFKGVAGGVWRMNDVANFVSNSQWPKAPENIENSCRFDDGSSDYLSQTFSSAGNQRTFTISFWFKRSNLVNGNIYTYQGAGNEIRSEFIIFNNYLKIVFNPTGSSWSSDMIVRSSAGNNILFKDTSAWYHVVMAFDTTQSTEANRLKVYVNGDQQTMSAYPSLNFDTGYNTAIEHGIGTYIHATNTFFDGYFAEFCVIDGLQLDPTSFGETDTATGIWKPKKIGTFASAGTNSFYLDFKDSSNLGNDASGLNNDFTVNNITSIDQSTDSCVENYATMNPLYKFNYNLTLSDGNLSAAGSQNQWQGASGSIAINTGKWFYEAKFTSATDIINWAVGFMGMEDSVYTNATRNFVGFYNYDGGEIWVADSGHTPTTNDYGTFSNGDIIGIALDYDNEYISVYKNGSAIVTNFDYGAVGTSSYLKNGKVIAPKVFNYGSGAISLNFGNPPYSISSGNADANGFGNFEYAVPSGYYALNSSNLNTYG